MKRIFLSLILGLTAFSLFAQENNNADTTRQKPSETNHIPVRVGIPGENAPDTITFQSKTAGHSPERAGLYSAVLPGLGQAYNGKYWKIPIIYGAAIVIGYGISVLNDNYNIYRNANIAVARQLPEENPFSGIPGLNLNSLPRAVESSRRDRDFFIIIMAALYGLNIVDAIVDAHLKEFEVNEDLSFNFKPAIIQPDFGPAMATSVGLALTFTIK